MPLVANDVPRIYGKNTGSPAVLIEGQRTNLIKRTDPGAPMSGPIFAGTTGSSAALSTHWSFHRYDNGNLNAEVVGSGVQDGLNYLDVRVYGNIEATRGFYFIFQTGAVVGAYTAGDNHAYSIHAALRSGDKAQLNTFALYSDLTKQSDGSYLTSISVNVHAQLDRTFKRISGVASVAAPAEPANALDRFFVTVTIPSTAALPFAVDHTFRIAAPQFERSAAFSSSFIPSTAGTATTRAHDTWTANGLAGLLKPFQPFTLAVAHWNEGVTGFQQPPLSFGTGSGGDLGVALEVRHGTGYGRQVRYNGTSNAVAQPNNVARTWLRTIVTSDGSSVSVYSEGALSGTVATPLQVQATTLVLGSQEGQAKHTFGLIAPGAPGLGIPFITPRAMTAQEIADLDVRWLAELNRITLPTI
ncbi:hypothetical protein [Deinococcus peraridilitoris]|uniref:Uncharacterized protein n=1 Tax=Deinococcus peraridilitoris (strain DSM 19664 / LMG 22246 / CIP 109416 / KR-200) TaxID=937777 RepID=L0A0L1_DEIPD|nr:hypothetical protein [Deinococcus peraridilitoris]AFZ66994.1 hypothetical protein Deipe_1453 [Deinococcus peraridilitoris DSM 19664]